MIESVKSPCFTPVSQVAEKSSIPVVRPSDSLVSLKTHSWAQMVKNFKTFLQHMWTWVKYNLFSWFFDKEEELNTKRREDFNDFRDLYFEHCAEESGPEKIRQAYQKLDPYIRELLSASLYREIKKAYPEKADQFYQQEVEKVLENPYLRFKRNGIHILALGFDAVTERLFKKEYQC